MFRCHFLTPSIRALRALNAARALDIITAQEFSDRTRHLLGALKRLPLFAGQLPHRGLWDQGSAILGIHAARQLGLLPPEQFNSRITRLLHSLQTLPLPATGVPNKAYSTTTAQMRQLDNTPDPNGTSGWSALDTARFLMGLHVLRSHYPEYRESINRIVSRWKISQLVKDGWLYGNIPDSKGQTRLFQEGRLGYEQYAAQSLQLWGIEAKNALHNPPVQTVEVDGIPLQVDRRNLENSGATNYLTNEPYLLWGLEIGWSDTVKPQVLNLLCLIQFQLSKIHLPFPVIFALV